METIDYTEKKTIKEKLTDVKVSAKKKMVAARDWCVDHQEATIAIITVAIPMTVDLLKTAVKRKNCYDQRKLKDNYIYDRSRGHYYELKRKPTSRQWAIIDDRRDQGERLSDILDDLHLLK